MEIPANLKNELKTGRVVLFLGSGASKEALNNEGKEPPIGNELGKLLADRFLGGEHSDQSLSVISELAISESDLITVQSFIASTLTGFKPAPFHKLIPTFRWRAIFTTNYDLILEETYDSQSKESLQQLVPFIHNLDRVDDSYRYVKNLPYIKLHGCISRIADQNAQLILTPDQYITHRKGRDRLFNLLKEWGHEYTIVFVGHGLQDTDLRAILLELDQLGDSRPRYYLVARSTSEKEIRLWDSKRITVLKGSFSEFITAANALISPEERSSTITHSTAHPISSRFAGKKEKQLSESCIEFLENDVEYIHSSLPIQKASAEAFYKGFDLGWYPIEKKLDVRRELLDSILFDRILSNEDERPTKSELYLIKAEAGSGKTILLRRLAWDTAMEASLLSIYARPHGKLKYESFEELYRLFEERIFLFVDNAADRASEIEDLIIKARKAKLPLTIISAERLNEWNIECERLEAYVNGTYQLPYLNNQEIEVLLGLLEKNDSLGYLTPLSHASRVKELEKRAGRQLLVALHEATEGKPFEQIIYNEYNGIRPLLAQSIYLTVCTLNRLNIFVRAGLISRIYGIPFTEFKNKLIAPLEHVVHIVEDPLLSDYLYSARHSEIAEIVFKEVLKTPDDRFNEYSRILAALNLSYSADSEAYRKLIRGRSLLDMFPDHTAVVEIFKVATRIEPNDPYLFHQQGIYEMHRPNGNLEQARKFLERAKELDSRNSTIIHSMAELARLQAEKAKTKIEKERYRKEAEKLANSLIDDKGRRGYARHTLIKIYMDKLSEALDSEPPIDREIDELIQKIEGYLERGLQESPEDAHLLVAESKFHSILNNKEQAFKALLRAFNANKRNPFIAGSLSRSYQVQGEIDKAIKVIESALETNPNERRLHYQLAMLLKTRGNQNPEILIYHLKRGFTPGDQSYDAQFWYAYYCYLSSDPEKIAGAKTLFRELRDASIPYDVRIKIKAAIESDGQKTLFSGKLVRKDPSFGFVRRDGIGDDIFIHMNHVDKNIWDQIRSGTRIQFNVGFNFGGPTAFNVQLL